ncbi:hypothetical protein ACW0S0_00280, partial [Fusobacterium polymorphum]
TNGERRVVDSPTTFIIGDGSNLKVGKVENTAGAIGATGSEKLSRDEYIGHNLENVDKSKTAGGSVGVSASGITSLGGSLSIAPKGMPAGSASDPQKNGERGCVDSPTTFIIGGGGNLKVGKVENTAGAIGTTGSGKLSIDEYVGYNLEKQQKVLHYLYLQI